MAVEPTFGQLELLEAHQGSSAGDQARPRRGQKRGPNREHKREGPRGPFVSGLGLILILLSIVIVADPPWVATIAGTDRDNYAFMQTQPGTDEPVTWNHCRAIHYEVNPMYAPKGWESVVRAAFDDVGRASGFVFVDDGRTQARDVAVKTVDGRTVADPVLVMWSNGGRLRDLHGDVAGVGGSATLLVGERQRYVTGRIALDADVSDRLAASDDWDLQRLILAHEIGHVLGLDHVRDRRQVMYDGNTKADELGRGDIAGLKALHAVPCD